MALDHKIYAESSEITDYLLTRHKMYRPRFRPGSFPLHNIMCLEPQAVAAMIYRILAMTDPIEIDRTIKHGENSVDEYMMTEEPLYPESRRITGGILFAFGANPVLITDLDLGLDSSMSPFVPRSPAA